MTLTAPLPRRFLKLDDVAEMLSTSTAQVYALVRRGDLPSGGTRGRGQWRCSVDDLDAFVERLYAAWGTPIHPRNDCCSFQRLVQKAGLRRVRLHDLRHTAASLLLAQEVAPRVVMEILGHSQISVTMNT